MFPSTYVIMFIHPGVCLVFSHTLLEFWGSWYIYDVDINFLSSPATTPEVYVGNNIFVCHHFEYTVWICRWFCLDLYFWPCLVCRWILWLNKIVIDVRYTRIVVSVARDIGNVFCSLTLVACSLEHICEIFSFKKTLDQQMLNTLAPVTVDTFSCSTHFLNPQVIFILNRLECRN